MGKGADKTGQDPSIRRIASNRKARFDYHVDEDIEAGLVLTGTEVKSLRDGKVQLVDGYATIEHGQAFLNGMHISEYANGTYANHEPRRVRKLLLHKKEIQRLARKTAEKGYTLIPLELYFKRGRAKVRLGLCRGKRSYDKRASIKERDEKRELRQRGRR